MKKVINVTLASAVAHPLALQTTLWTLPNLIKTITNHKLITRSQWKNKLPLIMKVLFIVVCALTINQRIMGLIKTFGRAMLATLAACTTAICHRGCTSADPSALYGDMSNVVCKCRSLYDSWVQSATFLTAMIYFQLYELIAWNIKHLEKSALWFSNITIYWFLKENNL